MGVAVVADEGEMSAPNAILKNIRPTLANARPLTHYLDGFHEVLLQEDVLDFYREYPALLGKLMLDCIDSNLCPFFVSPLYEIEDDDEEDDDE